MKVLLAILCVLSFLVGIALFLVAKNAFQETEALVVLLTSSAFLVGAGVLEAIGDVHRDVQESNRLLNMEIVAWGQQIDAMNKLIASSNAQVAAADRTALGVARLVPGSGRPLETPSPREPGGKSGVAETTNPKPNSIRKTPQYQLQSAEDYCRALAALGCKISQPDGGEWGVTNPSGVTVIARSTAELATIYERL